MWKIDNNNYTPEERAIVNDKCIALAVLFSMVMWIAIIFTLSYFGFTNTALTYFIWGMFIFLVGEHYYWNKPLTILKAFLISPILFWMWVYIFITLKLNKQND